jgi:hypothetical protein
VHLKSPWAVEAFTYDYNAVRRAAQTSAVHESPID